MRLRHLVPLAAIAVFAGTASAAELGGLSGAVLGAEVSAVVSCDRDGVRSGFVLAGDRVTAVSIRDLSEACVGQTVDVTVAAGDEPAARGSGDARPGTTEITLSRGVPASDVTDISVIVSG
jgi:hypothetical protein